MKHLFFALFLLAGACVHLELRIANTSGGPISKIEVRTEAGSTHLQDLAEGENSKLVLKLEAESDVNVNYLNKAGVQYYTSAPMKLSPSDSGFVLLSVTAKGTLDAVYQQFSALLAHAVRNK